MRHGRGARDSPGREFLPIKAWNDQGPGSPWFLGSRRGRKVDLPGRSRCSIPKWWTAPQGNFCLARIRDPSRQAPGSALGRPPSPESPRTFCVDLWMENPFLRQPAGRGLSGTPLPPEPHQTANPGPQVARSPQTTAAVWEVSAKMQPESHRAAGACSRTSRVQIRDQITRSFFQWLTCLVAARIGHRILPRQKIAARSVLP